MSDVNPLQFGQVLQKVDDLCVKVDKHIDNSDKRYEDAANRLQLLEQVWKFGKWLLVILGILWPIFVPIFQKMILHLFFPDTNIADLISFISFDKLL